MRLARFGFLGVMLGFVIGGVPLVGAQVKGPQVDPFDHGISYVVWIGGLFVVAFGLAVAVPQRRWAWAFAVLAGHLAAIVIGIIVVSSTGRFPNVLWPLTLALSLLIGVPPTLIGAYLGSLLSKLRVEDG